MSWYTRQLKDTVTYWEPTGKDAYSRRTWATPVTIRGRWQRREEIFYDSNGVEQRATTTVLLAQNVVRHGWLAKGDHTGTSDPTDVDGAAEIQAVRETDSISQRYTSFKALLQEEGQSG